MKMYAYIMQFIQNINPNNAKFLVKISNYLLLVLRQVYSTQAGRDIAIYSLIYDQIYVSDHRSDSTF